MKNQLRQLFAPVLNVFEKGDGNYRYQRSHRTILKAVGALFLVLSLASLAAAVSSSELGGLIPFLVFFGVGAVCFIVGFLGTDQAVARLWGNK